MSRFDVDEMESLAREANEMPPDAQPGAWQDLALRFARLVELPEPLPTGRCPRCVSSYGLTGRPVNFASDPVCAFASGRFQARNWNCETANALRELCGDLWSEQQQPGAFAWRDDNAAASFGAFWVPEFEELGGFYVAMSWYKNRGATGQAWWFSDDAEPHPLTLAEADCAIRAVAAYRKESAERNGSPR